VTSKTDPRAVLDASALLAYLQDEPGSEYVEKVLDHAAISTVNLAEVLTIALHRRGQSPSVLRPQLLALGIQPFDFTAQDSVEVAQLWVRTRRQGLSLGDRACLALGKRLGAKVLSAERQADWRRLGLKDVEIETIR